MCLNTNNITTSLQDTESPMMPKFSNEKELFIVQFMKKNPVMWDSKHPDFRKVDIKGHFWSKLANELSLEVSELDTWYKTQRKTVSNFQGPTKKIPTIREKWVLENLSFIKETIRKKSDPKDRGVSTSILEKRKRQDTCINLPPDKKIKLTNDKEMSELDTHFLELSKKCDLLNPNSDIVEEIKMRSQNFINELLKDLFTNLNSPDVHESQEATANETICEDVVATEGQGDLMEDRDVYKESVHNLSSTAERIFWTIPEL